MLVWSTSSSKTFLGGSGVSTGTHRKPSNEKGDMTWCGRKPGQPGPSGLLEARLLPGSKRPAATSYEYHQLSPNRAPFIELMDYLIDRA